MRVLIVDDEPAARARLRRLLAAEADVAELHEAPDAPAALALVHALAVPPDLALLDIEMPGGNGVQLAAALREAGVRCVVFSTAHAEHALQAFELAALDYLLKPYTAERLAAALARARELIARPAAPPGEWWVEGERLRLADVQWISAADNYVELHLPPRSLLERATLADALQRPGWAARFLRVHRSHAVNPAHVRRIERLPSGEAVLMLACGATLRVSRGHRAVLDQLAP
ncbi:LytR/AlgR family response regulator transcription factor [Roseateles saccharophilus]|uniref:LytTR family two component transcriptional regulator n=1 Tax=Roseateles saccharophilus TaxID=304 RepID=A0A4R3UKS7_ROSSA|nr:LytTR family DNA-binding domain-containing protein [Roseateles saccharophilus]MDG0834016.1 response regulator transcription factor [Roseateles saccharophilus]TCU90953.1 LytTR family two component transcriptional regulator [Roseateles saccharophilus]